MKNIIKTKVKPKSIQLLLGVLALLTLIRFLDHVNVVDLTAIGSGVIGIAGPLFLILEIGLLNGKKKGELKGLDWFIAGIAVLALLSVVLGWLGVSIALLSSFETVTTAALLFFIVLEIFR